MQPFSRPIVPHPSHLKESEQALWHAEQEEHDFHAAYTLSENQRLWEEAVLPRPKSPNPALPATDNAHAAAAPNQSRHPATEMAYTAVAKELMECMGNGPDHIGGFDHIVVLGLGSAFRHQGVPGNRWPRGNSVDRSSAQLQLFHPVIAALKRLHPAGKPALTVRAFELYATLGDVVLSHHYDVPLEHKFEDGVVKMKAATTSNIIQSGRTLFIAPDIPREFSAVIDIGAAQLIQSGQPCEFLIWGSLRLEKYYSQCACKLVCFLLFMQLSSTTPNCRRRWIRRSQPNVCSGGLASPIKHLDQRAMINYGPPIQG
jgi:hypothetical protein